MDAQLPPNYVEILEEYKSHHAPRKEEAVNQDQLPLLAAYRDEALAFQAAEQLVEMLEDPAVEARKGEDLPKADRAALLRKARQPVG